MRLLITGAEGFIGTHLVRAAVVGGNAVYALSRRGRAAGGTPFAWSLCDALPPAIVGAVDVAIHLAHDFAADRGAARTVEGTIALAEQLGQTGTTRQLYFSSYSSGPHALSIYGRTKSAIERHLSGIPGICIVRPGLVIGDGGLYGRIRKWARSLPVVPLPDGGIGELPVIDIDRLIFETMALSMAESRVAEANLFEPSLRSLREIVLMAAAGAGHRPLIMPVPSSVMVAALRFAAACRLPLPVNADNLAGFLANQRATHVSTLRGGLNGRP